MVLFYTDDIPIQPGQAVSAESADMLSSISEEAEADAAPMQRGGVIRNSKPKLGSFPVLGKKTKDAKEKTVATNEKKSSSKDSSKGIWNALGSGAGDMVDSQKGLDNSFDANSSLKDEISMTSVLTGADNSDTRSQGTTDSLDMEAPSSRFAAMQVSSV